MGYIRFPLTPALSLGRGRMVHRLAITPVPEFAQYPSAKHQSDACCSLSLRERARVGGKYSVEHAKCSVSHGLLSSPKETPSVAQQGHFDAVLADLSLSDFRLSNPE